MMPQTTYCFQSTCTTALTATNGTHQLAGRFMTAQMSIQQSYVAETVITHIAVKHCNEKGITHSPFLFHLAQKQQAMNLSEVHTA